MDATEARHEYLYVPDDDSEYGPVWSVTEASDVFSAQELADALPAELVINLGGHRGHYLTADWLSEAADLLESCQLDCATYHLDDPGRRGLRDAVENAKCDANDAWARYHAHNDLVGRDASLEADYGTECDDDCACHYVSDLADDVESLLSELGFVTEWNDGVRTYRLVTS
jgi:hypothetical protein